jgi:enamine deaminase RidA (YjgF/YER057c/UK114 family)
MLNCLAAVKAATGDLDKVTRVVKLLVMVNADPEFDSHFVVGNGASDLLVELYGDQGRHARSAVGMSGLPLRAPVEVEMIVEVAD